MSKKQIGKRLLQILIVLIGVSFFTFGLTYLSPGDPAEIMLTECGNLPTPELLEQTRHELGLDQPFLVQYGSWVKGVLTGDMGTSYAFKVPVTEKLMKCFWPTLQMSLFALLLMILFSIPCGILSAVYQNKLAGLSDPWDYFFRSICPKLLDRSDSSEYLWSPASLDQCSRRYDGFQGNDPAGCDTGSVHVGKIYQTGKECSSGGTSSGLCHRSQNERYQGECDPLEACASKCNASDCHPSWTFAGISAWRNGCCRDHL